MASAGLEIKSTDLAHSVYIHFLFLKIKKNQADHLSHVILHNMHNALCLSRHSLCF